MTLGGLLVVSTAVVCVWHVAMVRCGCGMHLTSSRVIGPLTLAALTSLSTSLCLYEKKMGAHGAGPRTLV